MSTTYQDLQKKFSLTLIELPSEKEGAARNFVFAALDAYRFKQVMLRMDELDFSIFKEEKYADFIERLKVADNVNQIFLKCLLLKKQQIETRAVTLKELEAFYNECLLLIVNTKINGLFRRVKALEVFIEIFRDILKKKETRAEEKKLLNKIKTMFEVCVFLQDDKLKEIERLDKIDSFLKINAPEFDLSRNDFVYDTIKTMLKNLSIEKHGILKFMEGSINQIVLSRSYDHENKPIPEANEAENSSRCSIM